MRRGAVPAGLGARDTLRLEVCFHLYGNDLSVERGPIEAGLGWCCKEDTGFIGADAVARGARARPAPRSSSRSRSRAPGSPAPGNPVLGGGEVTSGTLSPCLQHGHRHGLRARRARGRGHPPGDRRSWQDAPRRGQGQAALQKGLREWRRPATPTSCSTTPSTTGRASTTDDPAHAPPSASPGTRRTRSARSSSSSRPRSARTLAKDAPYAEVESVKAVSDVVAPLSGEIVEVNAGARGEPGADQRGPLRRGLAGQGAPVRPRRARGAARRRLLQGARWPARLLLAVESLHRHHPRGPATRCSRRSASAPCRSSSTARYPRPCACGRELELPDGLPEQDVYEHLRALAAAQHQRRGRAELPRRRHVRPLRARADRHAHRALGVPHALHALPARDLPGQAAGDVRVPDRDLAS